MSVSNDPSEQAAGQFADLVRLQTDFQTRMAEETLRYLRAVQSALAPVAPTTVLTVADEDEVRASGAPGENVELQIEVENAQRTYVTATAALTPLVERGGTTWFPVANPSPPLLLVAPGKTEELRVGVALPDELAPGEYKGALLLHGFRHDGVPVVITVTKKPAAQRKGAGKTSTAKEPDAEQASTRKATTKKAGAKKTTAKKTSAKGSSSS